MEVFVNMGQEYYLGLDVGTNSVGYAVTDQEYHLLKFKGEPMWGTHVFDEAVPAAQRRMKRTSRRRLHRRQQRVLLVQEIFASEIAKTDVRFFIRLQEASLYRDEVAATDANILFNDADFRDKDYHGAYPTIHHLLLALIRDEVPHDSRYTRLVYLAVGWLVAHRGHFLSDVDKENFHKALEFHEIYQEFLNWMRENGLNAWSCSEDALQELLLKESKIRDKENALGKLLYDGKVPKGEKGSIIAEGKLLSLISGGKVKIKDLFPSRDYEADASLSFHDAEDKIEEILSMIGEDAEWILRIRKLYDWSLLKRILGKSSLISEGKVAIYQQHHKDLINLKKFIRRYLPEKYSSIFRRMDSDKEKNYVAYSYHLKGMKGILPKAKATQLEICDYLKKLCKDIECRPEDMDFYHDMMERLEQGTFLPKQVSGENRVIPYQLYYYELKKILEQAEKHLLFLSEKDNDGFTRKEKILSIFLFRIPYFVGPLHFPQNESNRSPFAWAARKKNIPIRPWNFKETIDFDQSEAEFIRRMTNTCTYLTGKAVLPQGSLLYEKFMVLNEINNIKVNGIPISVEAKKLIYHVLFLDKRKGRKVTQKAIQEVLQSNNYMEKNDVLSGVDKEIHSRLKSHLAFARFMENKLFTQADIERIIERLTYSEDRLRICKWLTKEFPHLRKEDIQYIAKLSYKDFGRLSNEFLTQFEGISKKTGEKQTILGFLWDTNDNLMQLLSESYTFKEALETYQQEYNQSHPMRPEDRMEDMRLSASVKRAIYRTLDIVKDVCKARKQPPKRIFIEMARGGGEKGKRPQSRRDRLKSLYVSMGKDNTLGQNLQQDVRDLSAQLDATSDNRLQSEVVYLYFLQLGKSMYSGEPIRVEQLKDDKLYNIDHIYPRCVVKDDSIDNKVLVTSKENSDKGDHFPISENIRRQMSELWMHYRKNHLISEEKYNRLMRRSGFTTEERWGFINRQLVETRQSTKALANIFKGLYPETEIIYTKAGLISEFRHEFNMVKCRLVNDLHHAKDAYLNIVVGNVYYSKFNQKWFNPKMNYSVKLTALFEHPVMAGKQEIWKGSEDLGRIRKTMEKNNIHYTRFAFIRKGGFFDEQPCKKQEGLVPLKRNSSPARYGGYNKPTASFYFLVRYVLVTKKRENGLMLVPVELLSSNKVQNPETAREYAQYSIAQIINKDIDCVTDISFPLGLRPIKINAMFSFDGYCSCLLGKSNKGKQILLTSAMNLCMDSKKERYMKHLESFQAKALENKNMEPNEKYDKISSDKNMEMYQFFCEKLSTALFKKATFSNKGIDTLTNGAEKFKNLSLRNQVFSLLSILSMFKTGRSGGCDLTLIGGSKASAVYVVSSNLQNLSKNFQDIRLIEVSASGLYTSKSRNLLGFL